MRTLAATGNTTLMNKNLLAGIAAGAAGTTALNAVTYLDMAIRARPSSSTPEETVKRTQQLMGVKLGDGDSADNRRSGLGALMGIAAGVGVGALYGMVRPHFGRLPLVVLGAGSGLLANVGTTAPMALLGVTDPRKWTTDSWLSDLVPHLAYGLATAATWEWFRSAQN
ncbi:hypothetical protein M8542_49385 [Amycolatopsis sp. OK19-0408]|uniref:Uncharacterized protein n=1 Tax=Amycolatopsis iheyensis TaxID=2945988 RepID=A0A9X2SRN3_9PSEU|nr:hypothetical protein [Amycolatopsis iheyensis]MCR6490826.1 hypothetical protein [Amycolatopsis iheyensis]